MFAKIHAAEIPWKDGLPIGRYDLVHGSPTYAALGYGYQFDRGKTVYPIEGRALARLLMSHGGEYAVYAHDPETACAVADSLRGRGAIERADEISGCCAPAPAPAPALAPEPLAVTTEPEGAGGDAAEEFALTDAQPDLVVKKGARK